MPRNLVPCPAPNNNTYPSVIEVETKTINVYHLGFGKPVLILRLAVSPIGPYPLCRIFRDWSPPKDGAPDLWLINRKDATNDEKSPKRKITKSNAIDVTDVAPLVTQRERAVPFEEADWYRRRFLPYKARDPEGNINSTHNLITLHCDINSRALDGGHIVFYPYGDDTWRTIWLAEGSLQLARHRNVAKVDLPTQRLRGVYLYARFAFNISRLAAPFLTEVEDTIVVAAEGVDNFLLRLEGGGGDSGASKQAETRSMTSKRKATEELSGQAKKK
ncbi:hypothetical protein DXG03_008044 [Asterophora parasitica]|uniref:HNH nuclease domain-containing protein n=1 Tax=Asterophora parasitica TaxID=117018 RepID=A0A9P7GCG2_9AGAR|nr:hypothetical protein DXG03_008044 [Asterophora parasitica]